MPESQIYDWCVIKRQTRQQQAHTLIQMYYINKHIQCVDAKVSVNSTQVNSVINNTCNVTSWSMWLVLGNKKGEK